MPKFPVVSSTGRILWYAPEDEIKRLISLGQARKDDRLIRLTLAGSAHLCRTRVARSKHFISVAGGMSQCYQTRDCFGRINGYKTIYPEDRGYFIASQLQAKGVVSYET